MFYRKSEGGTVLDHSQDKYADDCLFTDEEIVIYFRIQNHILHP